MTVKTLEQVNTLREAAKSEVFNMVAAIEALKATPLTVKRSGGQGGSRDTGFGLDIKNLFIEARTAGYDALNKLQLANMYCAAKSVAMPEDTKEKAKFLKKFYEHCLAKSDQPSKNNASPVYHYNKEAHAFSLIGD